MPRNLDRRVELLIPIENASARRRLISILDTYFEDTVKARRLLADGGYERVRPDDPKKAIESQKALYEEACTAIRLAEQSQPTVFEPHRAPGTEDD